MIRRMRKDLLRTGFCRHATKYVERRKAGDRGNTWWWNEEIKDTVARMKATYKEFCKMDPTATKTKSDTRR